MDFSRLIKRFTTPALSKESILRTLTSFVWAAERLIFETSECTQYTQKRLIAEFAQRTLNTK